MTPRTSAEILSVMERMADAQLALYAAADDYPADWIAGAFYVGLTMLAHVSKNPKYLRIARDIADRHAWQFHATKAQGDPDFVAHADNQCIGQMYVDLAVHDHDPARLAAMRRQIDWIIDGFEHPTERIHRSWNNRPESIGLMLPWCWCDALFMAPPVFTRLSVVTGDPRYIDTMNKQWWATSDLLYDPTEHLYYRDKRFIPRRTPNGHKVFWSRGNGWVVGGLCNVLAHMPAEFPTRARFETQFKDMMEKLLSLQQDDGLWRSSLLDPQASPWPETSGTGFNCHGLAWGVNNGLLDRSRFAPAAKKAWTALNGCIRPDGLIGWVQKVAGAPEPSSAEGTFPYAVGAFLLAGAEMIMLHEDLT